MLTIKLRAKGRKIFLNILNEENNVPMLRCSFFKCQDFRVKHCLSIVY